MAKCNVLKPVIIIFCFITQVNITYAQKNYEKAVEYFKETAKENKFSPDDLSELIVTDQYISKKSGIEHFYLKQALKGIEVNSSNSSIHFTKENTVLVAHYKLISNYKSNIDRTEPVLSAIEAIEEVAKQLGLESPKNIEVVEKEQGLNKKGVYKGGGISAENIPFKLVYQPQKDGSIVLAWDLIISEIKEDNLWHFQIDASTGKLLGQTSLVDNCKHNNDNADGHSCEYSSNYNKRNNNNLNAGLLAPSSYEVFNLPLESPDEGLRTIVINPADATASPDGWHLLNNTTTFGNNVDAFIPNEIGTADDYRPDGGANLQFINYPIDLSMNPALYQDAGVTNAFYIANKVHDILFHYGFDEVSGNFQEVNYTSLGEDSDNVRINVQNDVKCNASFSTQPDGTNGTMRLYVCSRGELKDGGFNNTTIIHEYGHGVSRRLVGGPANTSTINNTENLKEGWSDILALLFTMKPTDTRMTPRYYGSWFYNDPDGIRPQPYSTDLSVNGSL